MSLLFLLNPLSLSSFLFSPSPSLSPKPLEASSLFELAQVQLQSGNVKLALDYLLEAVQLFAQVLGPMHVSIANCYRWV